MGVCALDSDKVNFYANTRNMAHKEAMVLTKEWDPRNFPLFFLLSCRVLSKLRRENERSTAQDIEESISSFAEDLFFLPKVFLAC